MARKNAPIAGSDEWLNYIINKYIKGPIIVIFGMFIIGTLLDAFLNSGNTFKIIFSAGGGVVAVGKYYTEFWKHKK